MVSHLARNVSATVVIQCIHAALTLLTSVLQLMSLDDHHSVQCIHSGVEETTSSVSCASAFQSIGIPYYSPFIVTFKQHVSYTNSLEMFQKMSQDVPSFGHWKCELTVQSDGCLVFSEFCWLLLLLLLVLLQ